MNRLICAEELKTALISCRDLGRRSCEVVAKVIDEQPTIEAKPVVHGEWIYENYTWHCGVCGFHPFKGYIPETPGFNICPNCGADMQGKEQT